MEIRFNLWLSYLKMMHAHRNVTEIYMCTFILPLDSSFQNVVIFWYNIEWNYKLCPFLQWFRKRIRQNQTTPTFPLQFINKKHMIAKKSVVRPLYRVSQEERTKLREGVPYVTLYRYNPKHLYPNLNGYGDNGQRSLKLWQLLHTYWLPNSY